jgi:myo-inositol-1(or 4)-monophosphatase
MEEAGHAGSLEDRAARALLALVEAARLGGETALEYFRPGERTSADIAYKAGDSPVTAADLAVDRMLAQALRAAFPQAGWLSEETEDDPARLGCEQIVVLDPIDGTRAFMSGDPCWTVAIALVERGEPIAGVVHAPALGETYAASKGRGATLNGEPIRAARFSTLEGARVAGPKGIVAAFAEQLKFKPEPAPRMRSLAYRLCSVAAGRVEIGLAAAHSHDWDIAAADVILREAGAGLREGGAGLREGGAGICYNTARIRRDGLLAAPLEWLPRLLGALPGHKA